jgi:hypothetical protein
LHSLLPCMVCLFESECAQPCIQRLHATGAFQPCTCSSETTLMAVLSQIFLCRRATRGPKKTCKITEFDPRGRCRAAGGGCRRGARARPRQRPGGGGCARATPPSTGGCSSSRPPPAALDSPYVRAKQVQVIQNSTHVYHFGCV